MFTILPKLHADTKNNEEPLDFSKYSTIGNNTIHYNTNNNTNTAEPKIFPNSVEYYQKQKLLEKQAKIKEASIIKYLYRKPNPVSILPNNYIYNHPSAIPFNQPLSKSEADLFYSYEDYVRKWYIPESFVNIRPFQIPYDPMANIWNWNRRINFTGILSFLCASTDMYLRPNPQLFLKRSAACLAYPLFSYLSQFPEHRTNAFTAFGIFTVAPIYHIYSSSWEYRHLPARFFIAGCVNFATGTFLFAYAISSIVHKEKVRVYNPKLLEDYYNLLTIAKSELSADKK